MSDVLVGPPPDETSGFVHVDMDAFFASVEIRRRPELRGQPVVVGGSSERGVVAAASYEARRFGIHSAMPSSRARRLCPDAVFLGGDLGYYQEVSEAVMAIFAEMTPLIEPLSLDEAFLDVRGAKSIGTPVEIAHKIRNRILEQERLTCSIGIASRKFLAKLATDRAKPEVGPDGPIFGSGVYEIVAGAERAFLNPLPVRALWGVGPATAVKLDRMGVETVADLASLSRRQAERALGQAAGRHLHDLANAIDSRPVVVDRSMKSIGHEETFARDLVDRRDVERELVRMAEAVANRLRSTDQRARTVTLKLRWPDFTTITRSHTPPDPVGGGKSIAQAALSMLAKVDLAEGVRLLGVSTSNFVDNTVEQLTFDDLTASSATAADQIVGAIRDRFGPHAIGPAVLQEGPESPKRAAPGQAPWGPAQT